MAADLPGAVLGGLLVARIPPAVRSRLMIPLAAATGLPLLATAMAPRVPLTLLLWAGSGVLSSYMVLAQVALSRAVPDHLRARTHRGCRCGPADRPGTGGTAGGRACRGDVTCSQHRALRRRRLSLRDPDQRGVRPGATRPDGLIASAGLPAHAAPQPHDTRANGDS